MGIIQLMPNISMVFQSLVLIINFIDGSIGNNKWLYCVTEFGRKRQSEKAEMSCPKWTRKERN